eukprot:jgi/Ulvmu1/669/UM010_0040.1
MGLRKKLTAWSEQGQFPGCEPGTNSWRVLLSNGTTVVRCHVKFIEGTAAGGDDDDDEHDRSEAAEPLNVPHGTEMQRPADQGSGRAEKPPEDRGSGGAGQRPGELGRGEADETSSEEADAPKPPNSTSGSATRICA